MLFKNFGRKNNGEGGRNRSAGPSIITEDVVIEGSLISGGELQIDGTVNGDVRAHAIVIDSQGVVHGEVIAEEVLVRGRIIGPIRGIHVHVYAGGHVQGDVINETISVDNGAYIDGTIRRSDDPLADSPPQQQFEQQQYDSGQTAPQLGVLDDQGYRPVHLFKTPAKGT
jgi:cytoskeletal protein CcmA (bactofilin family)